MTQELQQLLERIQQEGVAKARTEAAAIIEAARQEAATLLAQAREQAEAARQAASRDAEAFARRGEQSVRQAARDVRLQLEQDIQGQFERLLRQQVDAALQGSAGVAELVPEAVTAYLEGGAREIDVRLGGSAAALAGTLLKQLRAQAAEPEGLTIGADAGGQGGFTVRLAGGRIEHSFTTDAITDALARLLRPQLAALLKPAHES